MEEKSEHLAEVLPGNEPESLTPVDKARYKLYLKPAPKISIVLKDCGDCETDRYGAIFGFSPR